MSYCNPYEQQTAFSNLAFTPPGEEKLESLPTSYTQLLNEDMDAPPSFSFPQEDSDGYGVSQSAGSGIDPLAEERAVLTLVDSWNRKQDNSEPSLESNITPTIISTPNRGDNVSYRSQATYNAPSPNGLAHHHQMSEWRYEERADDRGSTNQPVYDGFPTDTRASEIAWEGGHDNLTMRFAENGNDGRSEWNIAPVLDPNLYAGGTSFPVSFVGNEGAGTDTVEEYSLFGGDPQNQEINQFSHSANSGSEFAVPSIMVSRARPLVIANVR